MTTRAQDLEHLKLLSIFHYVVGGLTALFACLPLIHVAVGLAVLSGRAEVADDERFIGWIFVAFGAVAIAMGLTLAGCILLAGRSLASRRRRVFCIVVAGLECLLMPYGTVLGVFTLIVLMRDSMGELFGEAPDPVG